MGRRTDAFDEIASELRPKGYTPILVKAFPDFRELSNEEKVRVFADVSGFVVLENSFPAGQIAELKICAVNRIVTAVLHQRGRGSSYMVADYDLDYDYIQEFEYDPMPEDLTRAVGEAVDSAKRKIAERAKRFDERYPWRSKASNTE